MMTDEIEPIPADEARAILDAAIRERLGDDWQSDGEGWTLVTGNDYFTRLNKDRVNLDFYVDLMGAVTVEEKSIDPGQGVGRVLAWLLLGLSLVIAFLLARIVGFL